MNSLINNFIDKYLKLYLKNIEKLDFSFINSTLKISSVVPNSTYFNELLQLSKLGLTISSGIISNLTIDFPLNIKNNSMIVQVDNFKLFISEAVEHSKVNSTDINNSIIKSENMDKENDYCGNDFYGDIINNDESNDRNKGYGNILGKYINNNTSNNSYNSNISNRSINSVLSNNSHNSNNSHVSNKSNDSENNKSFNFNQDFDEISNNNSFGNKNNKAIQQNSSFLDTIQEDIIYNIEIRISNIELFIFLNNKILHTKISNLTFFPNKVENNNKETNTKNGINNKDNSEDSGFVKDKIFVKNVSSIINNNDTIIKNLTNTNSNRSLNSNTNDITILRKSICIDSISVSLLNKISQKENQEDFIVENCSLNINLDYTLSLTNPSSIEVFVNNLIIELNEEIVRNLIRIYSLCSSKNQTKNNGDDNRSVDRNKDHLFNSTSKMRLSLIASNFSLNYYLDIKKQSMFCSFYLDKMDYYENKNPMTSVTTSNNVFSLFIKKSYLIFYDKSNTVNFSFSLKPNDINDYKFNIIKSTPTHTSNKTINYLVEFKLHVKWNNLKVNLLSTTYVKLSISKEYSKMRIFIKKILSQISFEELTHSVVILKNIITIYNEIYESLSNEVESLSRIIKEDSSNKDNRFLKNNIDNTDNISINQSSLSAAINNIQNNSIHKQTFELNIEIETLSFQIGIYKFLNNFYNSNNSDDLINKGSLKTNILNNHAKFFIKKAEVLMTKTKIEIKSSILISFLDSMIKKLLLNTQKQVIFLTNFTYFSFNSIFSAKVINDFLFYSNSLINNASINIIIENKPNFNEISDILKFYSSNIGNNSSKYTAFSKFLVKKDVNFLLQLYLNNNTPYTGYYGSSLTNLIGFNGNINNTEVYELKKSLKCSWNNTNISNFNFNIKNIESNITIYDINFLDVLGKSINNSSSKTKNRNINELFYSTITNNTSSILVLNYLPYNNNDLIDKFESYSNKNLQIKEREILISNKFSLFLNYNNTSYQNIFDLSQLWFSVIYKKSIYKCRSENSREFNNIDNNDIIDYIPITLYNKNSLNFNYNNFLKSSNKNNIFDFSKSIINDWVDVNSNSSTSTYKEDRNFYISNAKNFFLFYKYSSNKKNKLDIVITNIYIIYKEIDYNSGSSFSNYNSFYLKEALFNNNSKFNICSIEDSSCISLKELKNSFILEKEDYSSNANRDISKKNKIVIINKPIICFSDYFITLENQYDNKNIEILIDSTAILRIGSKQKGKLDLELIGNYIFNNKDKSVRDMRIKIFDINDNSKKPDYYISEDISYLFLDDKRRNKENSYFSSYYINCFSNTDNRSIKLKLIVKSLTGYKNNKYTENADNYNKDNLFDFCLRNLVSCFSLISISPDFLIINKTDFNVGLVFNTDRNEEMKINYRNDFKNKANISNINGNSNNNSANNSISSSDLSSTDIYEDIYDYYDSNKRVYYSNKDICSYNIISNPYNIYTTSNTYTLNYNDNDIKRIKEFDINSIQSIRVLLNNNNCNYNDSQNIKRYYSNVIDLSWINLETSCQRNSKHSLLVIIPKNDTDTTTNNILKYINNTKIEYLDNSRIEYNFYIFLKLDIIVNEQVCFNFSNFINFKLENENFEYYSEINNTTTNKEKEIYLFNNSINTKYKLNKNTNNADNAENDSYYTNTNVSYIFPTLRKENITLCSSSDSNYNHDSNDNSECDMFLKHFSYVELDKVSFLDFIINSKSYVNLNTEGEVLYKLLLYNQAKYSITVINHFHRTSNTIKFDLNITKLIFNNSSLTRKHINAIITNLNTDINTNHDDIKNDNYFSYHSIMDINISKGYLNPYYSDPGYCYFSINSDLKYSENSNEYCYMKLINTTDVNFLIDFRAVNQQGLGEIETTDYKDISCTSINENCYMNKSSCFNSISKISKDEGCEGIIKYLSEFSFRDAYLGVNTHDYKLNLFNMVDYQRRIKNNSSNNYNSNSSIINDYKLLYFSSNNTIISNNSNNELSSTRYLEVLVNIKLEFNTLHIIILHYSYKDSIDSMNLLLDKNNSLLLSNSINSTDTNDNIRVKKTLLQTSSVYSTLNIINTKISLNLNPFYSYHSNPKFIIELKITKLLAMYKQTYNNNIIEFAFNKEETSKTANNNDNPIYNEITKEQDCFEYINTKYYCVNDDLNISIFDVQLNQGNMTSFSFKEILDFKLNRKASFYLNNSLYNYNDSRKNSNSDHNRNNNAVILYDLFIYLQSLPSSVFSCCASRFKFLSDNYNVKVIFPNIISIVFNQKSFDILSIFLSLVNDYNNNNDVCKDINTTDTFSLNKKKSNKISANYCSKCLKNKIKNTNIKNIYNFSINKFKSNPTSHNFTQLTITKANLILTLFYHKAISLNITNSKISLNEIIIKNCSKTKLELLNTTLLSRINEIALNNFFSVLLSSKLFGNFNNITNSFLSSVAKIKKDKTVFSVINFFVTNLGTSVRSVIDVGKSIGSSIKHNIDYIDSSIVNWRSGDNNGIKSYSLKEFVCFDTIKELFLDVMIFWWLLEIGIFRHIKDGELKSLNNYNTTTNSTANTSDTMGSKDMDNDKNLLSHNKEKDNKRFVFISRSLFNISLNSYVFDGSSNKKSIISNVFSNQNPINSNNSNCQKLAYDLIFNISNKLDNQINVNSNSNTLLCTCFSLLDIDLSKVYMTKYNHDSLIKLSAILKELNLLLNILTHHLSNSDIANSLNTKLNSIIANTVSNQDNTYDDTTFNHIIKIIESYIVDNKENESGSSSNKDKNLIFTNMFICLSLIECISKIGLEVFNKEGLINRFLCNDRSNTISNFNISNINNVSRSASSDNIIYDLITEIYSNTGIINLCSIENNRIIRIIKGWMKECRGESTNTSSHYPNSNRSFISTVANNFKIPVITAAFFLITKYFILMKTQSKIKIIPYAKILDIDKNDIINNNHSSNKDNRMLKLTCLSSSDLILKYECYFNNNEDKLLFENEITDKFNCDK